MRTVEPAALTATDAHALVAGSIALHDATDLDALATAMRGWIADLIPYDAIDVVGALGPRAPLRTTAALDHRLAIRTAGGGRALVGLVLGRYLAPFSARDEALAALLGPQLGAAVDHVRLRAARQEQRAALAELTQRERQVLALVAEGCTNRMIADTLFIEQCTVEKHVEHIRAKLGARSRAEAAARWARATV